MRGSFRLGRVAGVELRLHYTWFLIAGLITVSLVGQFHFTNPDWSPRLVWFAALVTAVLFFGSIVLHELAHSLVALSQGLPVRSITLFALGGVSQIEREAISAGGEFWMAIAGPLTSAAIGVVCLAAAAAFGWSPSGAAPGPAAAVLGWLGYINVGLAAFNMIPGFPLDGGRVLRAIAWRVTRNADRATRIAARIGQVVAFLFIAWGLFRFSTGMSIGSLWLAFIGWFLLDASRATYAQVELVSDLRDVHVRDVMLRDCTTVPTDSPVDEVVEHMLHSGQRCYFVAENGDITGLVTLGDIRKVPRERWAVTAAGAVMQPLAGVRTVSPDTPALETLETMSRADVGQMAVVADGHVEGMVSRDRIIEAIDLLHARNRTRAA